MKKNWVSPFLFAAVFTSLTATAQVVEEKVIVVEGEPAKKEMRQVIVTGKGEKKEKMTVVVDGDNVTINGVPADEYKSKNKDVDIKIKKVKDIDALTDMDGKGAVTLFGNGDRKVMMRSGSPVNENRPMLGVTTDAADKGAEIKEVTKESAAEKMGLQKGDIITKIGDDKIETPDDLSEAVQKHKPGDKVELKYLRNGKEMKGIAELTKWKGAMVLSQNSSMNFNFEEFEDIFKDNKSFSMPKEFRQGFSWNDNAPKMGLSVQDTDDGKGVKVIEVDAGTNADKAEVKTDDVITHVDDKAVNSVDEISKLLKEKKENPTVRLQVNRNGKSQNIEVKMPRKIKTADL